MTTQLRYPIGIQTFEAIRTGGYLYVDKTAYLYRLVKENRYVFLSRPRRFGKSLLLSTIEAYFEGRKELFEGLAISELEKDWETCPVLRLDLSMESYDEPEKLDRRLSSILSEWESVYEISVGADASPASRFERIITAAAETSGRKVVVLVDEYDKPILHNLHDIEKQERVREKLQGFYSVIKGMDRHIRFAMLSGVSKFAHLSIFSGLNNLTDISLDLPFNNICGITESEMHRYFGESVSLFAEANRISCEETWDLFKRQYDGYHFAVGGEDVYNPFSVLSAFFKQKLSDYWFSTGTPSFLVKLVRRNDFELGELEGTVASESSLRDITDIGSDIVPYLFQAGYLTIKGRDAESGEVRLGFPNEEVSRGFWDFFIKAYFPKSSGNGIYSLNSLIKDLNDGDAGQFLTRLRSLISSTTSESESDKEIHFQNVMAIIGKMLGFRVSTEVHSALGRCDMLLESRSFIYIFEFKVDSTPEQALEQIESRGYALPYLSDPRPKILVGVDFSTATRTIESWQIKRI